MIRFVLIGLFILAVWLALAKVIRMVKVAEPDWSGIAFAVGFVALAFYLRHITGIG